MRRTQPRRADLDTHKWRQLRLTILERDHWTCLICGRPIDRHARRGTRWAASVDHIVPPALGGNPYDPANLRAAHIGCNSARHQGRPTSRASRPW